MLNSDRTFTDTTFVSGAPYTPQRVYDGALTRTQLRALTSLQDFLAGFEGRKGKEDDKDRLKRERNKGG